MPTNLYDAHRQWATRPADQRFASLKELLHYTQTMKNASSEAIRSLNDINLGISRDGGITMNGSGSLAYFSNWGFGQLCRSISAPAAYLRTLPPDMVRNCLQYGVQKSDEKCKVLARDCRTSSEPGERYVSAFTSPSYGRIWDADIVESLMRAVEGTSWRTPPAEASHRSENSGLYASDRDMFAFMVNDENPIEVGNARLGRGFFVWNSETGASTFGLTTFLYNYVCGNHIVWGAEDVRELKIYHRKQAPSHFYSAAIPLLNHFVENRSLDEAIKSTADQAMNQKIGSDLEETLTRFKAKPFTKKEITSAWETGVSQREDVTTLWGMVQGLTAYARDMKFIDKRVNLERRAGALLGSPSTV